MSHELSPMELHTCVSIAELRLAWQRTHGATPPPGLGRDLLTRGVTWKQQATMHGPLPASTARELSRLAGQLERSGELDVERRLSLKAGTRLVRDWHGETYHVAVASDGYFFQGKHYTSLSTIAQAITGVKWSGPRFFGLSKPVRGARTKARAHV